MGLLLGSGNTKPQYPYDMWYGIEGDFTSRDYKLKRVGNLDLHKTLPIQAKLKRFVENPDGSVKYYLHPNDSRKKDSGAAAVIDSTDGNVMLEKPEYYFRLEIEGTKWIRAYSEYPCRALSRWSAKRYLRGLLLSRLIRMKPFPAVSSLGMVTISPVMQAAM